MSDSDSTNAQPDAHQTLIIKSIPEWLIRAPAERRLALKNAGVVFPDWYRSASAASHEALKQATQRSWVSQTRVDRLFEGLADVRAFAEPLLVQALKSQFKIELNVRKTYLRLYVPKDLPVRYEVTTISLLDAALHNFEMKETAAHYFDSASCFITEPGATGQFDILQINSRLSVAAFASLCRQLDIGGRYNQQLEALLLPADAAARAMLANKVIASQQDRFMVATLLARMKGDIGHAEQTLLPGLLTEQKTPLPGAKALRLYQLSLLGTALTGIVLFSADPEHSREVEPVIAYIPDDPEHPLKTYASTREFVDELTRQLRSTDYQRFFARFVAHDQRGTFFATLLNLLNAAGPDTRPNLRMQTQRVGPQLWTWLYQSRLNQILNDARVMAVSTADEDRKSRWEQWDSLGKVATVVLEVATLAAIPFVPFLGELMLAYTLYQLLDDTFTGILDWAEGQLIEASAHLLSIAETVAQLGAFALGGLAVGKLLSVAPGAFVNRLKVVDMGAGQQRLWNPDLSAYERAVRLPVDSRADALGLHRHQGARVLPLDGKTYEVVPEADGDAYRIRHPDRPDAYKPQLAHNGAGAWAHEVERPMEWRRAQLFRRLGHSVAEFSDDTAGRILAVSGIDEAVLRDMHVHTRRPPALLEDTIRRFKLDQQIQAFIAQMQSTDSRVYLKADPQMQVQLLRAQGVSLQDSQLRSGDVVRRVVETLEEAQLKKLLGESPAFGDSLPGVDVRAARLRLRIAGWAQEHLGSLFEASERHFELSSDENTRQIRRIFPDLPKTIAEELWRHAAAADRLHMQHNPGITRRMAHEALFYLREVRLSRAYEGLYLETSANPDSDRLALHRLESLNGWSPEVRIEVRDGDFDGALVDSIGGPEASIRKILVRQNGQYQAFDGFGKELHALDDLYGAVQHALPDAQRRALGLPHVGQGAGLRQAVRQQTLMPRSQARALLGQPPLEAGARSPMGLAVGRSGYLLGGGDFVPEQVRSVGQRLQALYPTLSEEEMTTLRSERLIGEPVLAVARLESEYVTLVNELEMWSHDVPSHHPTTGSMLADNELSIQRQGRKLFAQELQSNWSRRLTTANRYTPTTLDYDLELLGELPVLSADFSHVRELSLSSSAGLGGHSFLASFPGVRYLTLSGFALETLPLEIYQMRALETLTLDDCAIELNEAAVEGLAHMEGLTLLHLDNNRLGLTPDVRYMSRLDSLYLKSTGLMEVPVGLFDLEQLAFADLRFNQITTLPDELFEVADAREVNYNLLGNPLSEACRSRIENYIESSSLDKKIMIQFDGALDEEIDWQEAPDSDDSGVDEGDPD
ncbi:NEL domain-containing protein [Pseudomonas sp. IT-P44]|uniref:dermonecrotic toxin domain-containing protein n=1 Tax=Pseudomonas sp. IT-P44 TaxID=3026451 RepID=UPI0039E035CE